MHLYVDVVLPVPLPGFFTYALPPALQGKVDVGHRVNVPFGNKKVAAALIVGFRDNAPEGFEVKEVLELVDPNPCILPGQLSLWQWIADYYLCSIGEVYKAALPARLKKEDAPKRRRKSADIISSAEALFNIDLPILSQAQQTAFDEIHTQWKNHAVCLLHGVTSSGKTEIYIHLISEAITKGQQVLYLLPEIVLTSQLTERLKAVFGDRLGVYHSKYTEGQRTDVWQRQLSDHPYDIIVGVRSSVFLPFQRIGLVIVDEEHETSFKQQEPAPRYHARNVALMLAHRAGAKTLLGTATPSLESYFNACAGKYGIVRLTERFGQVQLPEVEVVDVKELRRKKMMRGSLSPQLLAAMHQALSEKQQVILFQNRRGFATQIECDVCGWVPKCPHCDVSLTLHKRAGKMTCHYCGYTTDIPETCPACENSNLRQQGYGTERIEEEIQAEFPAARVARMDLDTTRTRTAYEKIIDDFAEARTDILIGTQMVTKGLDFERVSVVGILQADTMLNLPDFRAYERSFQMMAQVAGRAGRRERRGHVFLQTRTADLPLVAQVVNNDYDKMYQEQMLERSQYAYPPFVRLVIVYVKHRSAAMVDALSRDLASRLAVHFGHRVLGPDEPPVGRIQSLFIRRVILKLESSMSLQRSRQILLETKKALLTEKAYGSALIYFDVDPL